MSKEAVPLGEIMKEVGPDLKRRVFWYTVGIIGIERSNTGDEIVHHGTGTLVAVGDKIGILTAYHVVNPLLIRKWTEIGLAISSDEHSFKEKSELFHCVFDRPRPSDFAEGPDWVLLIPPPTMIGTVVAKITPWQLEGVSHRLKESPINKDFGFFAVSGFPGERVDEVGSQQGIDKVYCFSGLSVCSFIHNEYKKEGYDYVDLAGPDQPAVTDLHSYGGMSGGGLWWVPAHRNAKGKISIRDNIVLAGIAFSEIRSNNVVTAIRCHYYRSIYERILTALSEA